MTRETSLILLAFALLFPLAARAETADPVVVELFTSQSCESCPGADALIKTLSEEDAGVIALACHVDLQENLGWKDTMAQSLCSKRHDGYEDSIPLKIMEVPTIIINGKYDAIGGREKLVRDGITAARATDPMIDVTIGKRDDMLDITLPASQLANPVDVLFVGFANPQTVKIEDGPNIGQSIEYLHPVLYLHKIFTWDGKYKTTSIPLKAYPAFGYAVIIQEPHQGPMIGAASIKQSPP